MVALARSFNWRNALVIVNPETSVRWHRSVLKMSGDGSRICEVVRRYRNISENEFARWLAKTQGEERTAPLLKLGIRVSLRTVGKYLKRGKPRGSSGQRWKTSLRNHANAIIACDFFVSISSSLRFMYIFVAMKVGSRRILPTDAPKHPTAE